MLSLILIKPVVQSICSLNQQLVTMLYQYLFHFLISAFIVFFKNTIVITIAEYHVIYIYVLNYENKWFHVS